MSTVTVARVFKATSILEPTLVGFIRITKSASTKHISLRAIKINGGNPAGDLTVRTITLDAPKSEVMRQLALERFRREIFTSNSYFG